MLDDNSKTLIRVKIDKLHLEVGDLLIIQYTEPISNSQMAEFHSNIQEFMAKYYPGVQGISIPNGMKISLLKGRPYESEEKQEPPSPETIEFDPEA